MSEKVKIKKTDILSDEYYTLQKVTFEYKTSGNGWQLQQREVFERGNAAAILLYNRSGKVILTKQFRMPTYLNGNASGMMIEVCAGMLEENDPDPAERIKKEVEEETGYRIEDVQKVCEAYTSPGAVTEIIHLFVAEYAHDLKVSEGGGLDSEQENIEVLELDFEKAYQMIGTGEIKDAKTIMLLQHAKIRGFI